MQRFKLLHYGDRRLISQELKHSVILHAETMAKALEQYETTAKINYWDEIRICQY